MTRLPARILFITLAAALVIGERTVRLQQPADPAERFEVADVMIRMRDGVRLNTKIFTPKNQTGTLPIIMRRTPYGVAGSARTFQAYFKALADEGYIFVFQDIRGKFGSEGTFVMQRPPRAEGDTTSLDEGTDTYDTIEWLLKNVRGNSGRVGMLGISYDGWTTIVGALQPHPALKAISPQASPADMWLGDDFHHNGAFRLSYGFEYAAMMESGKNVTPFTFDRYDTFDWYLSLGPLSNVNARYLHGKIPTWNDYVAHPDYDAFWKRQTMVPHLKRVKVPTLNVAGWWDQEDFFYGPVRIYDALEQTDTQRLNYLVVGPWRHGGWAGGTGESLGAIRSAARPPSTSARRCRRRSSRTSSRTKGRATSPKRSPSKRARTSGGGGNQWPPASRTDTRGLYFGPDEQLTLTAPTTGGFDEYVSDPAHPVPYRHRPIQATYFPGGSKWSTWLVEDQRFVDDRADVLSWETAPLEADLTIAGEVVAHLFASTTGSDADWIVKLIDVYPEDHPSNWDLAGFQLMVSNEVFRGRYRTSFEKPSAIVPNAVLEYTWSLHTQNYTFKKGHRIMVQVQSTWFPLIDRNPQTFVPNIFEATARDFKAGTHRIHRSPRYPSRVDIPVVR